MSRIELTDNTVTAMMKMSEGNPGAAGVMLEIIEKHDQIDPQAMMGGIGAIMMLDTWGIYGSDIYILHNDKCNRDIRRMLMLMRAVQLGLLPQQKIKSMAADQMRKENLTEDEFIELDKQVCERLSEFARSA